MSKQIGNNISCGYNSLKSLTGIPKVINGRFNCIDNNFLNLNYVQKLNFDNLNNVDDIAISLMCEKSLDEKELLKIDSKLLNDKTFFLLKVYIIENNEKRVLTNKDILAIQEKHLLKNGITEIGNTNKNTI